MDIDLVGGKEDGDSQERAHQIFLALVDGCG